jgi:hypothetical protein
LKDRSGLFNSSLEGNVTRAIDIHERDKINVAALTDLIRAAVALKFRPRARRSGRPSRPTGITRCRATDEMEPYANCGQKAATSEDKARGRRAPRPAAGAIPGLSRFQRASGS